MRTALICFVLTAVGVAALSLPRALSNADFIYSAICAAALADGEPAVSPYFPAGYGALVFALLQLGLSSLHAGCLLSALGTGLSAGAAGYVARLANMPALPALLVGLLAAALPSVFIIALNPQLDALYTGLGCVLLAAALRAFQGRPGLWVFAGALLSAALLLTLRYHAVLLCAPVALVLLFSRQPRVRGLGAALLVATAVVTAANFWLLHEQTGSYATAARIQLSAGATYRESAGYDAAVNALYDDYPAWLAQRQNAEYYDVLAGMRANWPQFLTRKAVLAGALLWLLPFAFRRRPLGGSGWLLAFVALYTLALSPTYFTERASALPELAAMLAGLCGIGPALFTGPATAGRKGKNKSRNKLPAALPEQWQVACGFFIAVLALAGLGWNAWRYAPLLREQQARRNSIVAANQSALELAGGDLDALYGRMDLTGWPVSGKAGLPAASYSRLWLDDPALAALAGKYAPRHDWVAVVEGRTAVRAVLLFDYDDLRKARFIRAALDGNRSWSRVGLPRHSAAVWVRQPRESADE